MKNHILGLALFSFVVGAAAFVYAMYNVAPVIEVPAPTYPQTYSSKTSCWRMKHESQQSEISKPIISQATLSAEGGLFIFEIGCVENPKQISLYFYSKNERNTKLIAVEEIDLKPSINCENNSSLYKSFTWAKEVNQGENIYVIARNSSQENISSTEFDQSLATPVLMAGGTVSF